MAICPIGKVCNPLLPNSTVTLTGEEFFNKLLPVLFSWGFIIGVMFFFLYFLLGGLKFIQSQGEKNKISEAWNQIMYACIGLIVLLSLYAVIKLIGVLFGISAIENLTIPFVGL